MYCNISIDLVTRVDITLFKVEKENHGVIVIISQ